MKKIIAINASSRRGWNTDILVRQAAEGAKSKGAEIEVIDLYRLEKYTGCVSCFGCKRQETLGRCICKDGLYDVLEKIRTADGLIIGSPVYLGDVTAQFRALYERLVFPYITYKKEISSYNEHRIPVTLIMTSNAPEESIADLMNRYHRLFEMLVGPTKSLISGDTLQVNNYEDYNWTMFDAEKKKQRREEIFPQEKEKAFTLGAQMIGE